VLGLDAVVALAELAEEAGRIATYPLELNR
jgi:hypothetical protein